ncbi:MAG: transcriptional regulator [Nocardioides sp.]|nr:transcriptional regulator [Nocardioides sp.]
MSATRTPRLLPLAPDSAGPRGNNLGSMRRHNLALVLSMVHHSGGLTRSALTRRTGLNRSTTAGLVGELEQLGLVEEVEPGNTKKAGRPSSVVRPGTRTVAIAVNPEVDALTIGVVGLSGQLHERIRFELDAAASAREAVKVAAAVIKGILAGLADHTRVIGIGVAVPGLVRESDSLVRFAPHLGWVDEPLAEMLTEATGLPVWAANDASLGAVAERLFGAGKGINDMVYLNGGASGIGGGVISSGVLLSGAAGYAGEFGHIRVKSSKAVDTAGATGTLEAEVTRAALMNVLGLRSADPDELERALLDATSEKVKREVRRQIDILAVALAGAINLLNPELILLGGFLGSLYACDPSHLEDAVAREALGTSWEGVRIAKAALGSGLLMVGAAELAFSALLEDPAGALPRSVVTE